MSFSEERYVPAQKPIHDSSGYAPKLNIKLFNRFDSNNTQKNGKNAIRPVLELKALSHKGFGLLAYGEHVTLALAKARLEHIMTAVAMNVVRMVAWLRGIPHANHAKTRTSRFAALAPA